MKKLLKQYFTLKATEAQFDANYLEYLYGSFPKSFGYARWKLTQAIADFYCSIANVFDY